MAREELIAGLKNAIERGQSAEVAARTLINAGYSAEEVREAYSVAKLDIPNTASVNSDSSAISYAPGKEKIVQQAEIPNNAPKKLLQEEKKKISMALIAIISLLFLILIVLAYFYFFGEKLLDALFGK